MTNVSEWFVELLFMLLVAAAAVLFAPVDTIKALMGVEPVYRARGVDAAGKRAGLTAACVDSHGQFGLLVSAQPHDPAYRDGWQAVAVHDAITWRTHELGGVRRDTSWLQLAESANVWSVPNGRSRVVSLARAAGRDGGFVELWLPGDSAGEPGRRIDLSARWLREASALARAC